MRRWDGLPATRQASIGVWGSVSCLASASQPDETVTRAPKERKGEGWGKEEGRGVGGERRGGGGKAWKGGGGRARPGHRSKRWASPASLPLQNGGGESPWVPSHQLGPTRRTESRRSLPNFAHTRPDWPTSVGKLCQLWPKVERFQSDAAQIWKNRGPRSTEGRRFRQIWAKNSACAPRSYAGPAPEQSLTSPACDSSSDLLRLRSAVVQGYVPTFAATCTVSGR